MKEMAQGESMKKGKKKSGVNKDGNNAILSSKELQSRAEQSTDKYGNS